MSPLQPRVNSLPLLITPLGYIPIFRSARTPFGPSGIVGKFQITYKFKIQIDSRCSLVKFCRSSVDHVRQGRSAKMDGEDSIKRDVKNHVLFEIATEVANRGK